MVTRSSMVHRIGARRLGTLVAAAAVLVAVACAPPSPPSTSSLVVYSNCGSGPQDYSETITSTATPSQPRPGGTLRFELGVRRLQIDTGPMMEGRYVFPLPAGVARVTGVEFADDNPNTWEVVGSDLHIRFLGPDGGWLVNDFPRITIVAQLSPLLKTGDVIAWKPYRSFEQVFMIDVENPLACTISDPNQVLQRLVVG